MYRMYTDASGVTNGLTGSHHLNRERVGDEGRDLRKRQVGGLSQGACSEDSHAVRKPLKSTHKGSGHGHQITMSLFLLHTYLPGSPALISPDPWYHALTPLVKES